MVKQEKFFSSLIFYILFEGVSFVRVLTEYKVGGISEVNWANRVKLELRVDEITKKLAA